VQSDVKRWSSGRYAFRLKTWRCCGLLWEELLSARFPGRDGKRDPACPTCGAGPQDHDATVLLDPRLHPTRAAVARPIHD
jgi:hypothetical protein